MFDRLFGKSRDNERLARRAEAEGDLARATGLWLDAERRDEAARVMLMRGDIELEPAKRLQHYVQAIATAPDAAGVRVTARIKRALLAIEMARSGATSAAARRDLLDAASELEALGESARAAEAYGLAGDLDGETRSLVDAGDVDKLEDVLERDEDRSRSERRERTAAAEVEHLVAIGQRREALARAQTEGEALEERARALRARRALAPRITIELRGRRAQLVLGDEVILGRSDATITIASQAASRRHVRLTRVAGRIEVRDLGSRNGTELRGMRIGGAIVVPMEGSEAGLDLKIGGEVPLRIAPTDLVAGAVAIEVGGDCYVAPLGAAGIGVGAWHLEAGDDGWVDLVTGHGPRAYLGTTELGARTALLVGDSVGDARGAPAVLRIVG